MSPAEPLTELRAATIAADYAPGDYSVRRDADGRRWYSGRCLRCGEPVGETEADAEVYHGWIMHGACFRDPAYQPDSGAHPPA